MSSLRAPSRARTQSPGYYLDRIRSGVLRDIQSSAGIGDRAVLGALLLIALALRLINLGHSYWGDENATVQLLRESPWYMLRHGIPGSESTPPLYYLIASGWSHVFGTTEFAVRSLTALIGVATVAVAYAIGVELRSRRAGLILAAFVAVSPFMVWYSQDARAYALVILLSSLGLLFFAQALRTGSSKSVWLWAVASAASLTAHYFAIFVVVPEAVALLLLRKTRPRAIWPTALVAAVWLALLPLLLFQRSQPHRTAWITFLGLGDRLKLTLQYFSTASWNLSFSVLAAVLVLIAVVIGFALVAHRIRSRELVILGVGVVGILLPVVASFAGLDYVNYQNLAAGWMPFMAALAVALASLRRPGVLLTIAVGSLAFAATVKVQATGALQRPDWRLAARMLAAQPLNTLFVIYPNFDVWALKWYAPRVTVVKTREAGVTQQLGLRSVSTRRLVILAEDPWVYSAAHTLRWRTPAGFRQTNKTSFSTFVLVTYSAPHALPVVVDHLSSIRPSGDLLATTPWTSAVFWDRRAAAR